MAGEARVDGLDEVVKNLRKAEGKALDAGAAALWAVGWSIANDAKRRLRDERVFGEVKRSIHVRRER